MERITIKEYHSANGGDYDCYKLSNGKTYWLWFKAPFRGGEAALVHIVTNDDKEVGTVYMEKTNYGTLKMHLEDTGHKIIRRAEEKITLMQQIRSTKKYIFDKIIKNLFMKGGMKLDRIDYRSESYEKHEWLKKHPIKAVEYFTGIKLNLYQKIIFMAVHIKAKGNKTSLIK